MFHNDALTFEQKRDAIVARIRATTRFAGDDQGDELPHVRRGTGPTPRTLSSFDYVWDEIYDIADADRVWMRTF